MEDMQKILDALAAALQLTRAFDGQDLELDYNNLGEVVEVWIDGDLVQEINVAMDSGIAMIRDVVKHIDA